MKKKTFLYWAFAALLLAGCGYSTRSLLPASLRSIYVEHFDNKIDFSTESQRNNYVPLLEVAVRNAIINRFLFDGNLKIAKPDDAALVLKGELVNFYREVLRYTDNDDVEEYRVRIVVNLTLVDTRDNSVMWTENGFGGEAEYYLTGANATSESSAIQEAEVDLAKRVVERTIENW